MKSPGGQRDFAKLLSCSTKKGSVSMAKIDRGICRQTVKIFFSLNIGYPGTFSAGGDDGERVVVPREEFALSF
jgi:hypothetical protein